MKTTKALFLVACAAVFSVLMGGFMAQAIGAPQLGNIFGAGLFAAAFIPKGSYSFTDTATPDLSKLTTAFVTWGGNILRKHVNKLNLKSGVTTYKNVTTPVAMVKLSAKGEPGPYKEGDQTDGNGVEFTDRTLTVYQSMWDFDVDPERYRNKYLASSTKAPFYEYILDQVGTEYLAAINNKTIGKGKRNAAGTGAADIADGWITILTAEAAKPQPEITAKAIGAIDATNAVTKVETFASSQQDWWREEGFVIKCSWATFDNYKKHYRASFGYTFDPDASGQYKLDGFANVYLEPVSWIKNDGLLGVVYDALAFGTDGNTIQVAASIRRNIIEVRLMMPVGLEFEDLECISFSDNLIAA
ncbi:hypothetical protein [Mucilaginibacter sp. CSA2-8R]|uniref:hypothetical protein n=1 Tax=Mucilaginibacter sp. CSA2-8R TaxID=3141542 RepID=UPI00315C64AE